MALRFLRFGLVGLSGVAVDMGVFFLLADARTLHLDISLSKALAAEIAILNNFVWNDLWTFRDLAVGHNGCRARAGRFAKFNLICLTGICLSVLILNLQVRTLSIGPYLANFVAIILVSIWNFSLNLKFGWRHNGPR